MKVILFSLFTLFLISCEEKNNEKVNLTGTWKLFSREEIASGKVENFPNLMNSFILLEFTKDSIIFYGCNITLGKGKYTITAKDQIKIEGFNYVEPCSLSSWIETLANGLIHAKNYSLSDSLLKITPSADGKYLILLKKD